MAKTKKDWIKPAVAKMKKKGTIGSFSNAAKKAGKSTKAYAAAVLSDPKASPKMKKKANFARNVAK